MLRVKVGLGNFSNFETGAAAGAGATGAAAVWRACVCTNIWANIDSQVGVPSCVTYPHPGTEQVREVTQTYIHIEYVRVQVELYSDAMEQLYQSISSHR